MKRKELQRVPIPATLIKETKENLIFYIPQKYQRALELLGINKVRITFISMGGSKKNGK